jgi:hypothetical protein
MIFGESSSSLYFFLLALFFVVDGAFTDALGFSSISDVLG